MTRYLTKPRPGGKKQTPEKKAAQPDRSTEEPSSLPEADKPKPKRGKKQVPVEEVFEASSFSSDGSEPESLRDMNVMTKPPKRISRPQQQPTPAEEGFRSDSDLSSDEPSSLREMGSTTIEDEPSRRSRDHAADTLNKESNAPTRPSSNASTRLQSSAAAAEQPSAIAASRSSRSASMRRSLPASMGASAAPPNNRHSDKSRRKSNSPVRRNHQRVYQDIRRLQNGTELVIPKLPFSRVIREVLQEYSHMDMRVTAECLKCLQEAAEIYLTQLMEDGWRCTRHRDRATLTPKDLRLVLMLRNDSMLM